MGMILYNIVLLLVIKSIRSYAGGYHASNYIICYLCSVVSMGGFLYIIKRLICINEDLRLSYMIIEMISFIYIYFMSPIENANKPLSKREKAVYGLKVKVIAFIWLAISYVLFWFNNPYGICIGLGIVYVFIGMVICNLKILIKTND